MVWEFLYAFQNCKLRTFSGNDGLISWTNFSTTHSVNTIGIAVAEKKFSISSIPTSEDIFFSLQVIVFFLILLRQTFFSFPETLDGIYWLPCQIMSGKTSIIKKTVRLLKLIIIHLLCFLTFCIEQSLLQPQIRFTDLRSNSVEMVMFFNGCQQKPGNKKEIEKKRLESIK